MNSKVNQIMQQRAIKVRIYPNKEQQILFAKTFGCCRYVWNRMLADEERFYRTRRKTPAFRSGDIRLESAIEQKALKS